MQTPGKGENVVVRRARDVWAEFKHVPACDVLRLVQPQAYLGVLFSVLQSYDSESAAVGQLVSNSFFCMEETMGVAKKVCDELGASQPAASFL